MKNLLIEKRNRFLDVVPEDKQTINDREWGVIRVGDSGPALVLLPGTLGRADIFWHQIDALKTRCRILAVSYPDSGGVEDWVQDIAVLMSKNGFDDVVVLGSSLGGYVAQHLAATYPAQISGLIAANTLSSVSILANFPPYNADLVEMPADELRKGFLDGMQLWADEQPERLPLIDLLRSEINGRIPVAQLRQRLIALKTAPELAALPNETKVVTIESADDRLIPLPVRDAVYAKLSPEKRHVFSTGSHFPYLTHPEAYSEILESFLGVGGGESQ